MPTDLFVSDQGIEVDVRDQTETDDAKIKDIIDIYGLEVKKLVKLNRLLLLQFFIFSSPRLTPRTRRKLLMKLKDCDMASPNRISLQCWTKNPLKNLNYPKKFSILLNSRILYEDENCHSVIQNQEGKLKN